MPSVLFLAFALGVMLSPDSLILLGNTLGSEDLHRNTEPPAPSARPGSRSRSRNGTGHL